MKKDGNQGTGNRDAVPNRAIRRLFVKTVSGIDIARGNTTIIFILFYYFLNRYNSEVIHEDLSCTKVP